MSSHFSNLRPLLVDRDEKGHRAHIIHPLLWLLVLGLVRCKIPFEESPTKGVQVVRGHTGNIDRRGSLLESVVIYVCVR